MINESNIEKRTLTEETEERKRSEKRKNNTTVPFTPNCIPTGNFAESASSRKKWTAKDPMEFAPSGTVANFLRLPGIFIFCMLAGYLVGKYNFNILFLLPIAHIALYYFKRRTTEYTRTLEVLQKEETKQDALHGFETVEWMNHIIKKIWDVSEQAISSIIFNEVNNVLRQKADKTGFSLRLAEITLGTRPPVIENILFVKDTENSIVMEFAIHFIPVQANEEILAYFNKERAHWNTYIEMQATVAKLVCIPILVQNFTFSGLFRVKLNLTQKIPFIKEASVSFLELPTIDFQLEPLKAIDMLDLPYVGSLMHSVIDSQITKHVLYPNAITVNLEELAKYRGTVIGVIYVYVHDLQADEQVTYNLSFKNNGKVFGNAEPKAGANPVFNQGFYTIISDTTQYIDAVLSDSNTNTIHGKIYLRNLNKFIYSENIQLSDQHVIKGLNITTQFYPITNLFTESAIVSLNLVSVEDLQATGAPVNKLYSTYCLITLEKRIATVQRNALKQMETKRIFVSKNPFYNETFTFFLRYFDDYIVKIRVMDEKENREIGTVIVPCLDIKNNMNVKYRIGGVENGEMNIKMAVKNVDMRDPPFTEEEIKPKTEECCKTKPVIKKLKRSTEEVIKIGNEEEQINKAAESTESQRIEDNKEQFSLMVGGHIKEEESSGDVCEPVKVPDVFIGIYNKAPRAQQFIKYTKAYRYSVVSCKAFGVFYIIFETDHVNVRMERFSTDLPFTRTAVVPIKNEESIRARLFMCSSGGDTLVSEEVITLDDTVVVFDKIRVEFKTENSEFTDYNEEGEDDRMKIVQTRIGEFNREGEFTANFHSAGFVQNVKLVHRLCTFLLGKQPLLCTLRENNKKVSTVSIPQRKCDETFNFGKSIEARLVCLAQVCDFKTVFTGMKGELEIFILKINGLVPTEETCNPYIKVLLNGEKTYRTETKNKALNPIFNESFKIKVNRETDVLAFHVYSANSYAIDSLLCLKTFRLYNLNNGYSRFSLLMDNGSTGEISNVEINMILSYKADIK